MATADQYVIVSTNLADKVVKGGPLLWDGTSTFSPGPGLQLITVEAARQGEYTWPARPITELNAVTLRERVTVALPVVAAYLSIPSPGPTATQTTAQVQRLTRLTIALAKLMLEQLDTTDGT